MSDKHSFEQLSALMDDELDTSKALPLLESLASDPVLRKTEQRMALVRACLRQDAGWVPGPEFSDRIRVRVEQEPTVLAPRALSRQATERFATFALAASMAVLAVLVVRSVNHYSPDRSGDLLANVNLTTPVVRASMGPDLQDYLRMHHESSYLTGMQGLMPSVRMVSDAPSR